MRRRKAAAIVLIAFFALATTLYVWNAYFLNLNYPEASSCIPILENVGAVHILPDGTYPINQTDATNFAKKVIADYYSLATEGEVNLQTDARIQRFFPLYHTVGENFNVLVARDDTNNTGRIEFLFMRTGGNDPVVHVYTNQTGADLRSIYAGYGVSNYASTQMEWDCLAPGTDMRFVLNTSPVGATNFPFIWITHLPLVQNNTLANAETAAQAIYNFDVWDENITLNPPFPSWGWFSNFLNGPYGVVFYISLLASLITVLGAFRGWFKFPRKGKDQDGSVQPSSRPKPAIQPKSAKTLSPSEARRYAKRHPESTEGPAQGKKESDESDKEDRGGSTGQEGE